MTADTCLRIATVLNLSQKYSRLLRVRKQDLPKEVYIEVITPKRTDEKQKNNQTKKLRIIELLDSMDSMGLSR